MDFWEAIVLIVAILMIAKVMGGGRWNKETRRWEKFSPDNPYVKQGLLEESPQLRREITRLNERVAVLEKLVIDPSRQLSDEIEKLRTRPTPIRPEHRSE